MSESEEHEILKHIGLAVLLRKGCSPAGVEVRLPTWEQPLAFELPPSSVGITDAAGLTWIRWRRTGKGISYGEYYRGRGIFAMEAKVSRSDFQRGFCTRGWNKMWLITPPDLLKPEEVPGGVGLYEYDIGTEVLKLVKQSAMRGYEPSQTALEDIERQVLWAGYGQTISTMLNGFDGGRMKRIFGGQFRLDQNETKVEEESA